MVKPFDATKLRKNLTKSIDGMSIGFNDPSIWIDTGNHALNFRISGSFDKGIPLGKVTMLAGETGCLPASATVTVRTQDSKTKEYQEFPLEMDELKQTYANNPDVQVKTPDGWSNIKQWFDKGPLPVYRVELENGMTTVCADKHFLEVRVNKFNGFWHGEKPLTGMIRDHKDVMTYFDMKEDKDIYGLYQLKDSKDKSLYGMDFSYFANELSPSIGWISAEELFNFKNTGEHPLNDCDFSSLELRTVKGWSSVKSIQKLNKVECFDFEVDHVNHRYWGDGFSSHNSGKSYIAAGNLVREAQKQGVFCVIIDTENALDEEWLQKLGVDTSEEKLLKCNLAMIDDVAKLISDFVKSYKQDYASLDPSERPKILIIIDSLGMLLTPTDVNQFESGDLKGDMGRKPKQLAALVRNSVNMLGDLNIGLICTNHTYASQDMFSPDPKISGGSMVQYAASIVVAMSKLKLKEDEEGNKTSEVKGIKTKCRVVKTRFTKPFEDVDIKIPYEQGMDKYSGLFDIFSKTPMVTREGNKYVYTALNGKVYKLWEKEFHTNKDGVLDVMMKEYQEKMHSTKPEIVEENVEEGVVEDDS